MLGPIPYTKPLTRQEVRGLDQLRLARKVATSQLEQEAFDELVRQEKERLIAAASSKRWRHRFIPFTFTLIITRR